MGNQLSITGTSSISPRAQLSSDELLAYQEACQNDQDVRKFDTELQTRTTRAINALVAEVNKPNSFSLDLLKEVTGTMVGTDQEVVGIILASKKDIWKNPELFSLVDDYYQTSLYTLEFCNNLERFLSNAKHKQVILRAAVRRLEEDGQGYKNVVEDLAWFRSTEMNFTEELLKSFELVYSKHLQMLERLQNERVQLNKKLKRIKSWRKTANVIFAATFVTVLVCSIVATAIAAPPVVTAIVTAVGAAAAWVPTENWFKRLWKGYEEVVKEQREVVSAMQAGVVVGVRDLDGIRVLVERLEAEIREVVVGGAEEENGVTVVVKEIEDKLDVFMRSVDELGELTDRCGRNVRQARAVVQQRIIKAPKKVSETGSAD